MAKNEEIGLTDKQERFCQEYLIDLNGTQAAIRAGYSDSSAGQIAEQNLKKLEIQERIKVLQQQIALRLEISQDWVLKRFKDISDRCMTANQLWLEMKTVILLKVGSINLIQVEQIKQPKQLLNT